MLEMNKEPAWLRPHEDIPGKVVSEIRFEGRHTFVVIFADSTAIFIKADGEDAYLEWLSRPSPDDLLSAEIIDLDERTRRWAALREKLGADEKTRRRRAYESLKAEFEAESA